MARGRKRKFVKICKVCGVEFKGARNSQFCPDCANKRHKQQVRKSNHNRIKNSIFEDTKYTVFWGENYMRRLKTRINHNSAKEYMYYRDEAFDENIGDNKQDVYTRHESDEDYFQYHLKLNKLRDKMGLFKYSFR